MNQIVKVYNQDPWKTEPVVWEPTYINVLDQGHIGLIDFMGDDSAIVNAARVSYGKGTVATRTDEGLIRYLMRHWHCYRGDMEVLTATGWKRWDQVDAVETYMVPDPITRTLRPEVLPLEEFDVDTDLYTFENDRMSYAVTEDHRMWFKGKYQDDFGITRVQDMSKWGHFDPLVGYRAVSGAAVSDKAFEFIGFFLGDGSYASTNRLSFHLKKDRKKAYLIALLDELDIPYEVKPSGTHDEAVVVWVHTPQFLRDHVDVGKRSSEKSLLTPIIDLDGSEVLGLWSGLVNSDGHYRKDRLGQVEFSSISSHLITLFEALSALMGMDAHRREIDGRICAYTSEGRTSLESRKQYHGRSHYVGKVYCVTTSTGLLVVRGRSDQFGFICGNTTPFEMVEFKFHVKAPIFVFRQWHRHRTASINEYSGRYSILDNEMYVPHYTHTAPQSANNKQGRQDNLLDPEDYNAVRTALNHVNETSYQTYLYLCGPNTEGIQAAAPDELQNRRKTIEAAALAAINKARLEQASKPEDERWEITEDDIENTLRDWFIQSDTHVITKDYPGIARELARMVLPVATYSQMYWKANLHNIMHFLRLRADSHAQYEIRVYAEAMMDLITPIVPMAMEAFKDYQLHGTNLSRMEGELIKLARSGAIDFTDAAVVRSELDRLGCSKREIDEFLSRY